MQKTNRKPVPVSTGMATAMTALVILAMILMPIRLSAAEFFQSLEDLPLAPGLTEIVDEGVEFDSPAGRIVTAVAGGDARADAVRAFYRKALPSLGWSPESGGVYQRDGEVLTLELDVAGKAVKLRIRVVPASPKSDR